MEKRIGNNDYQVVLLADPTTGEAVSPGGGGGGAGSATAANQVAGNNILTNIDANIGALDDAPAAADGTGNYSIIAALKRALLNWASLLARLPAALGPQAAAASLSTVAAADDPNGNGTRAYNWAQASRTAIGSASSAAVPIGALGASREVMLVASSRCFIKFGASGVAAAAAADADLLALPADAMFHLRIPAGVTHFRVIRDTADGFLRVTPVV